MKRRETETGYAIVEMLASLLIFAMTSVLMISGVVAGRRVWERIDVDTRAGDEIGGAQMLLRQRIEHMFPDTLFETFPPTIDMDGESTTLSFLATPRIAQSPSALRRYKIWLSPKGELVLSSGSTVATDPIKADENLVVLDRVQALDLAYFGPDAKGVSGWQLQWAKRMAVPSLVRVHVAFEPGDRRVWPDLLVKPITTIDSHCVLNPATSKCRGRL